MNIKSIKHFVNPAALLRWYERDDALDALTEEEQDDLSHACDYESIDLFVVNDSTVLTVDCVTGGVVAQDSIDEFAAESVRWAREQEAAY